MKADEYLDFFDEARGTRFEYLEFLQRVGGGPLQEPLNTELEAIRRGESLHMASLLANTVSEKPESHRIVELEEIRRGTPRGIAFLIGLECKGEEMTAD